MQRLRAFRLRITCPRRHLAEMAPTTYSAKLRDGRSLAYAVYGVPLKTDRAPSHTVVYHHGWPSSRLEGLFWEDGLLNEQMRMIAVDRPGIGGSSFNEFTFMSFSRDIEELLDQLGVTKAIQLGTSGGGPYAAACAHYLPDRTSTLGLAASMTHTSGGDQTQLLKNLHWSNALGYQAIANFPSAVHFSLMAASPFLWIAPTLLAPLASLASKYPAVAAGLSYMALGTAQPDRQLMFERPQLTWHLGSQVVSESVLLGTRGLMRDMTLTTTPWEFDPADISPGVPAFVFQGLADVNVTLEMAKYLEGRIPGCVGKYYEGEGHLTLVVNQGAEILHTLAEAATKRSS